VGAAQRLRRFSDFGRNVRGQSARIARLVVPCCQFAVQFVQSLAQIGIVLRPPICFGPPLPISGVVLVIVKEVNRFRSSEIAQQRPEEQSAPQSEVAIAAIVRLRR
jgi:hypothetical protein